ncbi:hypothetical protein F5Y17DRAFT_230903 [Xylariaceae sp. FL0594]|nr:hypothetical protein F5Y17DRAFT_230903 [Xylariaceae sp. FL0594]
MSSRRQGRYEQEAMETSASSGNGSSSTRGTRQRSVSVRIQLSFGTPVSAGNSEQNHEQKAMKTSASSGNQSSSTRGTGQRSTSIRIQISFGTPVSAWNSERNSDTTLSSTAMQKTWIRQGLEEAGTDTKEVKQTLQQTNAALRDATQENVRLVHELNCERENSQQLANSLEQRTQDHDRRERKYRNLKMLVQKYEKRISDLEAERLSCLVLPQQATVVDDVQMATLWGQLQDTVKSIAKQYFDDIIPLAQLSAEDIAVLTEATTEYKTFGTVKGEAHYLYQAVLWKFIIDNILSQPTTICGDGYRQAFRDVFQSGLYKDIESDKEYHAWRAHTAAIMSKKCGFQIEERIKTGLAELVKNHTTKHCKAYVGAARICRRPGRQDRRNIQPVQMRV